MNNNQIAKPVTIESVSITLESVTTKLESVTTTLESVTTTIASVNTRLESMSQSIAKLPTREEMNLSIDTAVNRAIDELAGMVGRGFREVDGKFLEMHKRFDGLEKTVANHGTRFNRIERKLQIA